MVTMTGCTVSLAVGRPPRPGNWVGAVGRGWATVYRVAKPGCEFGGPWQPTCVRAPGQKRSNGLVFLFFLNYFYNVQIIQVMFQNS
jgi:hypothetical protein